MNEIKIDDHIDAHERLALLAIEATDRQDPDVLEEIVDKADNVALLLQLAIAHAEDRALRGEAPGPSAD
ncbi:MAG: hypothetical protein H0U35_05535 [Sporichthyaceae bacterium]|nr:hypothetical protein [Sporichthyaceae bacterium]MBA3800480.1 hypothetical protein [Geodermatophilaceae bacterium]